MKLEVVITRHLFPFILAGVVAASTIFPVSAWSRDSFISGGEEYEDVSVASQSVYSAPNKFRMMRVSSEVQEAVEASSSSSISVSSTLPSSVDGVFQVMSKYYYYQPASQYTSAFESDYWRDVVATFTPSPSFNDWLYIIPYSAFSYAPDVSDPYEMVRGLASFCNKDKAIFPKSNYVSGATADFGSDSWSFTLNYDVSAFSSSAFSLDGLDSYILNMSWPSGGSQLCFPLSVDVLVNGQQVLSLARGSANYIDFGGYVYSGSTKVSTISFRWHMPFAYFVSSTVPAGTVNIEVRSFLPLSNSLLLTISFLDGQDVINAQNDKTKNDINKHDEYESQWTGSMTENFNALGFSDFSWSDSLISGFSLFSGVFMDIWRALGGATILFTFPLLLGIALLLVGRISRSGGRSGSGKGGGDGG